MTCTLAVRPLAGSRSTNEDFNLLVDLGELLGHGGVVHGALEVQKHLFGELTGAVDRPCFRLLAELLADAVVQVLSPCIVSRRSDVYQMSRSSFLILNTDLYSYA